MSDERKLGSVPDGAQPVPRDTERYKFLFTNGRPEIPDGYSAPLAFTTTRQLAGERVRVLAAKRRAQAACN
jgi:hypothetical protein